MTRITIKIHIYDSVHKNIKLFLIGLILLTTSIVYIFFPKNSLSSEVVGYWISVTSMPVTNNSASHYSFTFDNKLYSLAGANTEVFANGIYSPMFQDGTLSNWVNITPPPRVLWQSGARYNNYVYLLGGADSSITNINDVVVGMIDSSGNVSSWNKTTPLPSFLSMGATVIVGNKIYYAGGSTNREEDFSAQSNIWKADINTFDGTLSGWSSAGSLPEPMLGFGMVESNGYLIILGGKTTGNTYLSSVQKALIDPVTGNIEEWTPLPSLPDPVYRAGVTKVGNLIVSAGGYHGPSVILMDKVNFTEVDSTGNIIPWVESNFKLPQPNCCFSLSSWNDFIYMTGGFTGTYVNDVYMSKVEELIPLLSLSVPNLKQYIGGWENDLYGHTNKTIKDYGCVLTSASMVLKFFGHDIDPGELNIWLKEQKDGYIRNNLVNWLAISRYTKLHESTSSPTLEYLRSSFEDNKILNNLQNNLPTIVKVPGHFVVTKSQTETSFGINDPGYSDRDELSPEYPDNHIQSLNTYTPSQTDLSYMMFVGDSNLKFELFDSLGNLINDNKIQTFIEDPINELNGDEKSGEIVSILLYSKPTLGKYILKVKNTDELTGEYNFDAYLYDSDGNVIQKTFSTYFFPNDIYSYNIDFEEIKEISLKNGGLYKSMIKKVDRVNQESKLADNLIRQIINLTPKLLSEGFSLNLLSKLRPSIF
ncbi:MAG: C39 family peptidase [Candidatus Woesebacteria bacterium]|nr:C39 family peptidase [Candidatus Woesebacteria bacterium]